MASLLVIDDSEADRKLIGSILEGAGHEVHMSGHTNQTEALVEEVAPDVLLLDISMPDPDGYEVLESLRRSTSAAELPIVLISSKSSESDIDRGYLLGATKYLVKPFSPISLQETVQQCLRGPLPLADLNDPEESPAQPLRPTSPLRVSDPALDELFED